MDILKSILSAALLLFFIAIAYNGVMTHDKGTWQFFFSLIGLLLFFGLAFTSVFTILVKKLSQKQEY